MKADYSSLNLLREELLSHIRTEEYHLKYLKGVVKKLDEKIKEAQREQ